MNACPGNIFFSLCQFMIEDALRNSTCDALRCVVIFFIAAALLQLAPDTVLRRSRLQGLRAVTFFFTFSKFS